MVKALMEEYRRSAVDLKQILASISSTEFENITNPSSNDPDCKSIQTIVLHIISSGYIYANMIQERSNRKFKINIDKPARGILEIEKMLDYTEESLQKVGLLKNSEIETLRYISKWGATYDFEQLMEHAIVHVLRHRRQIENFQSK